MTNDETNVELIARARELCETINELALDEEDDWEINLRSSPDNGFWKDKLVIATGIHRLATTHLAEMDEHEIVSVLGVGATCTCGATYFYYSEIPTVCHKAVTKVKRLLGVE